MAKKKTSARRVPRSSTPRTFSDTQPAAPMNPADAVATAPVTTNGQANRGGLQDFRRRQAVRTEARPQQPLSVEYAYVPGDLKRLGLLALAMVGLMVVLGIIVH